MISAFEPPKVAVLSHTLKEKWKESNSLELLRKGGKGKALRLSEVFLPFCNVAKKEIEGTRKRENVKGKVSSLSRMKSKRASAQRWLVQ